MSGCIHLHKLAMRITDLKVFKHSASSSSHIVGPNEVGFTPLETFENLTVREAADFLEKSLLERKAIILVGNCWVEYRGRASSKLEPGERIVIIKEDGSVLVHRSTGYEPVNWQPPGCIFATRVKEKIMQIRAIRQKPSESIKISFDRVYLLSALSLVDGGAFALYASESDMQKAILSRPTTIEQGFKPIMYEKRTEPGFVDVYGIDRDGKLVVIEIKRRTADRNAVLQLAKYVESIKTSSHREVRGMLVAPGISKGVHRLLATLELEFRFLDPRKCAERLSEPKTKKLTEYLDNQS